MNIICDLDGTIALDHARNHYLHKTFCPRHPRSGLPPTDDCVCRPEDRDWKSYFDACDTDVPNLPVIEMLALYFYSTKHTIWILSGRSMSAFKKTLKWLDDHAVIYTHLQMRGQDDRTDDHKLKLKWADDFGLTPDNTLFVLEDRTRVVEAWRAKGFRCFQVAAGNF